MTDPVTLRPDIVATVLDEGALLVDLGSKYFFHLNDTGWAITSLLEDGVTVDHLVAEAERCGAPAEEVQAFVDALREAEILETTERATNPPLEWDGIWETPSIVRQDEPLQDVMVNAFDPSIPLAE